MHSLLRDRCFYFWCDLGSRHSLGLWFNDRLLDDRLFDNWLRLWRDHILVSVLSRRQGRFISRYHRGFRHFGRVGRALVVRRVTWHRRVLQGRGPHRHHEGRDTGDADTEYRTNEDAANKPA